MYIFPIPTVKFDSRQAAIKYVKAYVLKHMRTERISCAVGLTWRIVSWRPKRTLGPLTDEV